MPRKNSYKIITAGKPDIVVYRSEKWAIRILCGIKIKFKSKKIYSGCNGTMIY